MIASNLALKCPRKFVQLPKRSLISRLAGGLGFGLLALLPQAAWAQVDARASYVVTLGGINIANVDVGLTDDGQRYRIDLSASVAGLGNLVTSGTASASSSGQATAPALTAEEFDLQTHAGGEDFNIDISYRGRNVSAFRVAPTIADEYQRVPIERSDLTGVSDMMAAFLIKGGSLGPELCQRRMRIFTGLERFDLTMSFGAADEATSPRTGYQGPVVACTLRYAPISGHFTDSDITSYLAEQSRILIWYAPLDETGYFIPYRAVVGTNAGDLSMVLTGLRF